MLSRTSKAAAAAALILVAAIGGYWYWSPFLVIRQMHNAAKAKDADTFNRQVDYPRVRASLKAQLAGKLESKLGKSEESGSGLAALGAAIGMAFANPLIDVMVSPEAVMRAMQDGELVPKLQRPSHPAAQPPGRSEEKPGASAKPDKPDKPRWSYERRDANTLVAHAVARDKPDGKPEDPLGLVFQRSGFADWKLTDIRIPVLNKSPSD